MVRFSIITVIVSAWLVWLVVFVVILTSHFEFFLFMEAGIMVFERDTITSLWLSIKVDSLNQFSEHEFKVEFSRIPSIFCPTEFKLLPPLQRTQSPKSSISIQLNFFFSRHSIRLPSKFPLISFFNFIF
ncbi:Protein CBG26885 [Caenorhabditis briggsae]|uniref:Protein CBG26885 n=1 Tax=Caenorhabditis briggsae TaxID=6238 RepID=B6II85_CAEBR|nr:Protein CBG26885 [Caenorhabditis briggsae]CAR99615.1 Protein CBG26885 [Caenorhabditis briggsae]